MRLYLHPDNPEPRLVKQLVEKLKGGSLLVLPTDTVYAFVTLAQNKDSIAQIQRIKDLPKHKALTLYCRDFSQMSTYVRTQGNQLFRFMKDILPGPYTLIFDAAKSLPHYAVTKQNSVGIRIVEHPLIAAMLGAARAAAHGQLARPATRRDARLRRDRRPLRKSRRCSGRMWAGYWRSIRRFSTCAPGHRRSFARALGLFPKVCTRQFEAAMPQTGFCERFTASGP
jgi:hypothetical protein